MFLWQPLFAVFLSSFLYLLLLSPHLECRSVITAVRFTLSLPFHKTRIIHYWFPSRSLSQEKEQPHDIQYLGDDKCFYDFPLVSNPSISIYLKFSWSIQFIIESKFNFRNNALLYVKWTPRIFTAILISLTSSSSFETTISRPNKRISVFSRLILQPEHVLYLFRFLSHETMIWLFDF